MARIRTVKPSLARNKELFDMEQQTGIPFRFVWSMFSTVCDREGRFRWRPWEIKLDILPYDDIDFSRVLDALATRGFLVKYACSGDEFGYVPTFLKHQVINNKEKASELPDPSAEGCSVLSVSVELPTREPRVSDACPSSLGKAQGEYGIWNMEGKGKEGNYSSSEPSASPVAVEVVPLVTKTNADRGANKLVWEAYREAYLARYGVEPVRNPKVNANVSQFVARVGAQDAPDIIRFFVGHNDSFYVRSTHTFGLALRDAESLRTQWLKGRAITTTDVRRFEQRQQQADLLAAIERGEV